MSRSVLLRRRIVSGKVLEKIKTHALCSITIFFLENHAVYEKMWKNTVGQDRPQTTMWRMRIVRWIPKATNTHSEYVTLVAFPLKQRSQKGTSMLCCTYIACHVCLHIKTLTFILQINTCSNSPLQTNSVA